MTDQVSWLPGRVFVRLHERENTIGKIFIPDQMYTGQIGGGVVIGLSDDVTELSLGDVVVCYKHHGKIIDNWTWPDGTVETSRVAIYGGGFCPFVGETEWLDWWDSVLMKVEEDYTPTGKNILLDIGEKSDTTAGGIVLPSALHRRDDTGIVISVGPGVEHVKAGDEVVFNRRSLVEINKIKPNTALIPEMGIHCILGGEDAS